MILSCGNQGLVPLATHTVNSYYKKKDYRQLVGTLFRK